MEYETSALIRETAKAAAKEAVSETLIKLGMDTSDPLKMQRRMVILEEVADLLQDPHFEADLLALRQFAATLRRVKTHGLLTIVGLIIVAICSAIWFGFKSKLGGS